MKEFLSDKDISNYPSIELDKLNDIFLLDSLSKDYRDKNFDIYNFNGTGVPRVSSILKECIAKEYLINWASKIGYKRYNILKNKATHIGTIVHEMIERFLLNGEDENYIKNISATEFYYSNNILKAYENFKSWYFNLINKGYTMEVIEIEKKVTCPYYGGTIDCIAKINGKVYIIDFKTSKQISYEYIIQTCAYMWIINNGYCNDISHIDGIGIIRVDKEKTKFNDLFLNNHIPYQKEIIDQYYKGFASLLMSYYNNINMKYIFSEYNKLYNFDDTILLNY